MASTFQRKAALRKCVKRKAIFKGALLHIYKLKLQLEALKKDLSDLKETRRQHLASLFLKQLSQLPQLPEKEEVKVEKAGKGFIIRVKCEKGQDHKLVRILEAFEELGLVALQARVCCKFYFAMEAVVMVQEQELTFPLDVNCITKALIKAVGGEEGENEKSNK